MTDAYDNSMKTRDQVAFEVEDMFDAMIEKFKAEGKSVESFLDLDPAEDGDKLREIAVAALDAVFPDRERNRQIADNLVREMARKSAS